MNEYKSFGKKIKILKLGKSAEKMTLKQLKDFSI